MDIKEYSAKALRTAKSLGSIPFDVMHGAAGMAGESGEVIDIAKKTFAYGKSLDVAHMLEEIGDCLWYVNYLIHTLDSSWDEVLAMNIAKLEARYPDSTFNADHAINRNKEAEAEAMQR